MRSDFVFWEINVIFTKKKVFRIIWNAFLWKQIYMCCLQTNLCRVHLSLIILNDEGVNVIDTHKRTTIMWKDDLKLSATQRGKKAQRYQWQCLLLSLCKCYSWLLLGDEMKSRKTWCYSQQIKYRDSLILSCEFWIDRNSTLLVLK